MIRNLKALGLALCAVFAFGALSTSAASAANDAFTSGSTFGTTFLTGTPVGGTTVSTKWEPSVTVSCATGSTYTGSYPGTSATQVELTPAYTGCESLGSFVTIHDEGCKLVLTGTTDAYTNTSNVASGEDATVKLNCSHIGQIRMTLPLGCVITFKDTSGANTVNQNLLGVRYDNESNIGIWAVKVTVTVDKIHYTSAGCGFLGITSTDNDGFLTTNVTLKAYSFAGGGEQRDLTVS